VHERSKALFLALNAFESEIGTLKNRITGTLRLGLVDNTITDHELPIHKVIARISEKAPEARVELVIDAPDALLSEIANGGLDIALLPGTQPYQGLKLSRLREEAHSLYCAKGHSLFPARDDELSVERIEAFDFVVRPYANMRELHFFPKARARAAASNMEAQAMFVMSGPPRAGGQAGGSDRRWSRLVSPDAGDAQIEPARLPRSSMRTTCRPRI
jgi:LysR family transcriptional regulator, transcriptional activator for bauABCD operon